jgi:uncharacterized glyoxalase superfamily protein PhnB
MKIFLNVIVLTELLMSLAAGSFVEVVTAVQRHFQSGCVYLLHDQQGSKWVFTFCVSANKLFSETDYQETGAHFGNQ